MIAFSSPVFQNWAGKRASVVLSELVKSHVEIGSIRVGATGRIVLDNVQIWDQKDTLMLSAPRLAAKMNWIATLAQGQVSIANAQILGAKIHLYQETPESQPNFMFLPEAFASEDTTESSPLYVHVGSVIVRRTSVQWHQQWIEDTYDKFNPAHIQLSDVAITAHLHQLTDDSISVNLKRFSAKDEHGLNLKNLSFRFYANLQKAKLENFKLELPKTNIEAEGIWQKSGECTANINAFITPSDLISLVPELKAIDKPIKVEINADGSMEKLNVNKFLAESEFYNSKVLLNGTVENVMKQPRVSINIDNISASGLPDVAANLGTVAISGSGSTDLNQHNADLNISTALGNIKLSGTYNQKEDFVELKTSSEEIKNLNLISKDIPVSSLAFNIAVNSFLKGQKRELARNLPVICPLPTTSLIADFPHIDIKGYRLHDLHVEGERSGKDTHVQLELEDKHGNLMADIEVKDDKWTDALGEIDIVDFVMNSPDDMLQMEPLSVKINHRKEEGKQHLSIISAPLNLEAYGNFDIIGIKEDAQRILNAYLPMLVPAPKTQQSEVDNNIDFVLMLNDTLLLRKFAGVDLKIPETGIISGSVYGKDKNLYLSTNLPEVYYGSEHLKNAQFNVETTAQDLSADLFAERVMKNGNTSLIMKASANGERMRAALEWNNNANRGKQAGQFDITASLFRDSVNNFGVHTWIAPSTITINDTIWRVSPANIDVHDGVIDVRNLNVTEGRRSLSVNGRASKLTSDTIRAELKDINVAYVLDLINFDDVLFGGNATGTAYLTEVMNSIKIDGKLHVTNFTFNNSDDGFLDARVRWGAEPKTLSLEGHIYNPQDKNDTYVTGFVKPGDCLDLQVKANRFNLAFLNYFTEGILDDIQGHLTGDCRIFGKLGRINLEGGVRLEDAAFGVPQTNVRYHIDPNDPLEQDSVIMWPDNILLKSAILRDEYGRANSFEHIGMTVGKFTHQSFKNLTFDFMVQANKLLGFRQEDLDGGSFCGVAYITGKAHLFGGPGRFQVDVNASPDEGSYFTYNITGDGDAGEAGFVTYKSDKDHEIEANKKLEEILFQTSSDLHLNFNLNMNPSARLRLMINPKSGDYIELGGNGNLTANYYNKGRFRMYGTYTIADGTYRLNIQNLLHKDFTFTPGGTAVFNGDPYQATLNLQARYTIPNVSLNDLATTGLGMNNTRVDCIMNLGGQPVSPTLSFDFDLPNANEDQRQMVRALVSTEEEKNMQAIYLLGIGRFYSYGSQYQSGQNHGGSAMYSIMASTLAGQFNKFLSDAVGNNNWSVGANLRTGENGWDKMDVEGMLSGRMLNNRLLFNGNFGVRESNYTQKNVITDFDIQYILTKNGTVSLKGYNKTNDRYFVQNSFNVQGIGIQLQKDFNRIKELFQRSKNKKRQ